MRSSSRFGVPLLVATCAAVLLACPLFVDLYWRRILSYALMFAALGSLTHPPVPIALDESLAPAGAWERIEPALRTSNAVAVVLKPMLLGGIARTLDLAARARVAGLDVTVSHLFDGPVALAAASHLAIAVGSRARASGLAPHGGLAVWPAATLAALRGAELLPLTVPGIGLAWTAGDP